MYTSLRSCVLPDGKLICFIRVIMLIYSLVNRLHVIPRIHCFRCTIASATCDYLFHLCHRVDYLLVNRLHVISLILCFRCTIASVTRDHLFHLCHHVDLFFSQQITRDSTDSLLSQYHR